MRLLVFGLGYCGRAVADAALGMGWAVRGLSRTVVAHPAWVDQARLRDSLDWASHVLVTAPPGRDGDPLLSHGFPVSLWAGRWIGYLSTTGVYGDRAGAWVDETATPAPQSARSHARLAAEQGWGAQVVQGAAVDLFRLGGIYGPQRSPLDDVRAGTARRIIRPGHVFSRIHRDDIVRAVLAAMTRHGGGGRRVFNLVDDRPAEQAEVVAEAARLLALPLPPAVDFAVAYAQMSATARSFWAENRRVSSVIGRRALGIDWRYPDYRAGLCAVQAAETAGR